MTDHINKPPTPPDEAARVAALRSLNVLDTPPERCFDQICQLAQDAAQTPIALVSFIDETRHWYKASIGVTARQNGRHHSFSLHALTDDVLWVEDAAREPKYRIHPLVSGPPFVRFYAGAPILLATGEAVGAVCVISPEPKAYDARVARQLRALADLAADACALRRANAQLAAARRDAEAAQRVKGAFLTNMNHELRTPLNGVLAAAEVLGSGSVTPGQRELVEIIGTSARNLCSVLDDVLQLSSLGDQLTARAPIAFNAAELATEVVAFYRPLAEEKGLRVLCDLTAVDRQVLGYPACLRQVLRALISNAVKFTDAGSVHVSATSRRQGDAETLTFTVADTGIGFDSKSKERLFEPLEIGDSSLTRRHGGVGAGLAIAHAVAEGMGGSILAQSNPGEGAEFAFSVTLRPAPAGRARRRTLAPLPDAALTVLVAEDNPANRRLVELILNSAGMRPVFVEDGAQAVEAASAARFDLILMDIQMPVMDGLTAIRHIRRNEAASRQPRTPVCTVTAHAMPEHERAALDAGADRHMTKPVGAADLLGAVAALTQPADGRGAA